MRLAAVVAAILLSLACAAHAQMDADDTPMPMPGLVDAYIGIGRQATPSQALLHMTGCEHCGRAETAEPESTTLTLSLSAPQNDELRLGETRYSRRMRFDHTDYPDKASDVAPRDRQTAASSPRTE